MDEPLPPVNRHGRGSQVRYVADADQSSEDKRWMREALVMAEEAFQACEVPVGSVFVRRGKIIARARNRTNELMNVSSSLLTADSLADTCLPCLGHTPRRARGD